MTPQPRIHHLDALRCFCMLFGLLLHGATIGYEPLFVAIMLTSEHFRMPTFFLVSGFFTAMVCARSRLPDFLRTRGRMLLVPFAAALLLLNPVTNWLIQLFHGGGVGLRDYFGGGWRLPLPGPTVWHLHLWFLLSLFVYALLTPALLKIAGSGVATRLVGRLEQLPGWARLVVLTLAVATVLTLMRGVSDQLLEPLAPPQLSFLIQATSNYLAYFLAGLFAFRHRKLFDTMHQLFWPGLILFGAAYLLHGQFAAELPRAAERASYWISRAGFIFLVVCGLLAIARRLVKGGSPWLTRMTNGVYSFYLFHFLVIYTIANLLRPLTDNLYLTFALILAVGYPLLFLIHERLIAPSPLMSFLFNGKPLRPPARAVAASRD